MEKSSKMKAIYQHKYGNPSVLHISEFEKPIPASNEVLVKNMATSENR